MDGMGRLCHCPMSLRLGPRQMGTHILRMSLTEGFLYSPHGPLLKCWKRLKMGTGISQNYVGPFRKVSKTYLKSVPYRYSCLLSISCSAQVAFLAPGRGQLFRNLSGVHSTVGGARGIRSISRILSGYDWSSFYSALGIVYPEVVTMIQVSHRVVKIQYKPDIFISYKVLQGK